ncbi:MAG TPA: hypothetical protein VGI75_08155 [Pirellulales bacterium]
MKSVKKTDEPYPCMNHPCGCPSAEECWRHCCCFTLTERLAWAREHHITPPDYALAEARAKGIDWNNFCSDETEAEADGCSHHAARDDSCCGHLEHETSSTVVLIQAMKCQGADQNWIGQNVSLPPPAVVEARAANDSVEHRSVHSETISSPSFAPPTPPPRFLSA